SAESGRRIRTPNQDMGVVVANPCVHDLRQIRRDESIFSVVGRSHRGMHVAKLKCMTARSNLVALALGGVACLLGNSVFAHQAAKDYSKVPTQTEYPAPLAQTTQPSYVPQSVALSGPEELRNWHEGEPIPPGYKPVERVRKGLIIGGAITFGALYSLSALV